MLQSGSRIQKYSWLKSEPQKPKVKGHGRAEAEMLAEESPLTMEDGTGIKGEAETKDHTAPKRQRQKPGLSKSLEIHSCFLQLGAKIFLTTLSNLFDNFYY